MAKIRFENTDILISDPCYILDGDHYEKYKTLYL